MGRRTFYSNTFLIQGKKDLQGHGKVTLQLLAGDSGFQGSTEPQRGSPLPTTVTWVLLILLGLVIEDVSVLLILRSLEVIFTK